jgi:hypothetical protein
VAGSCGLSNEAADSVEGCKFLEQLSDLRKTHLRGISYLDV